jgi:parallel beta-helix repeat protein
VRIPLLALLLVSSTSFAAVRNVSTVTQLQSALASARAGDEVVLADGTYAVNANLNCAADGTASQPIIVRAANRHAALIRFNATEGFKVSGRYWIFDGLTIEGVCAQDVNCEHAFHVTGHAENFVLRNSRVRDFNAQLKVNAAPNASGVYEIPHRGLIENNEVYDTRVRNTSTPVTKLNIDTGDDWVVRGNYIHDFSKANNGISYGAFMKSGGRRGVFERNRVICTRDAPAGNTRIGLSFGGGGTGNAYCAPAFDANVPCDPEHADGILRNNVIINCSDVGIYLNKAANTKVLFNTLIATTGVDFRFASTTGEAHGNVLSSVIRTREGGTFTAGTNMMNVTSATWDSWYVAPLAGDLRVEGNVSQLIGGAAVRSAVTDDHCARPRPSSGAFTLGALEHSLGDCGTGTGTPTDGGTPADAGTGTGGDGGTGGGTDGGSDAGTGGGPSTGDVEPKDDKGGCSTSPGLATIFLSLLVPVVLRRRPRRPAHEG